MGDATHGGKGSRRRPTDAQKYNDNYDRIFCNKLNTSHQSEVTEESTIDIMDYTKNEAYAWRPANGGLEKPFTWNNKEYLYMWNAMTGEHAYYNATDDKFETEVEFN